MPTQTGPDLITRLSQVPLDVPHGIEPWRSDYTLYLGDRVSLTEIKSFNLPATDYPELVDRAAGSIGHMLFHYWERDMCFHVIAIGVEPEYQGRGYCSMMVRWSEEAGRALRCRTIELQQVGDSHVALMLERRKYHRGMGKNYVKCLFPGC